MVDLDLIIRCSSLDRIMGATRGKQPYGLSKTAQSEIEKIIDAMVYNTPITISSKAIEKGVICEDDSINLFNRVYGKNLTKNQLRLTDEYITGECDLLDIDSSLVVDIKTSWGLQTFAEQRRNTTSYEWQLRGYMSLYNVDNGCTAHALVNTPEDLAKFEVGATNFDHIPEANRIIIGNVVKRCEEKEEQIIEKVKSCRLYAQDVYENFMEEGRRLPCD